MKTLLSRRFRVTPNRYVGLDDEPTDAFLLIGDEALRQRRGVPGYPHLYDLGEEWHRWTGLPFVFARWVVRRDLNDDKVRWLEALLSRSIELGLGRRGGNRRSPPRPGHDPRGNYRIRPQLPLPVGR